ncbi:MAG TPA: dihydrolipoyl dehydrogenase [Pseudorhodoplanes sp.]|nr:dihydrolipoyl dehydrogenase [Pseudorhodoplanes sp.]
MEDLSTQVLVVGGGPGGYVAAIRAGQLGLSTVLVEEGRLGGTCLNVGCIPSKAVIHAADAFHEAHGQEKPNAFGLSVQGSRLDFSKTVAWKDGIVSRLTNGVGFLLKKSNVTVLSGTAELQDGKTCVVNSTKGPVRVHAEHLILATGSTAVALKSLPFGGQVISSTEALSLGEVPKKLVVVGAGYIGLELGTAFAKLGSHVTVVEAAAQVLPAWDADLTKPVAKRLAALGIKVLTNAMAQGLSADGKSLSLKLPDRSETIEVSAADKILVAVGRAARVAGFGLEKLDLAMNGAFVKIDARCATSMRNVWAIGDVTGEPMLAHRAMAQGVVVADIIAGHRRVFDNIAIPAVCFTDPEIVSLGLLPAEAKAKGHHVKVGTFPFAANGRAMTQDNDAGFVRVVARAEDELVLGIQAVGHEVSELASTFGLALEMGATLTDVARTIHAHPTRGEAFQEAALDALGTGLHQVSAGH